MIARGIRLPLLLTALLMSACQAPAQPTSATLAASPDPAALLPDSLKPFQGPFEIPTGNALRGAARVYLPKQYDASHPWPLVLMLHGLHSNATQENAYLGLSMRVSSAGFILVTAEGTTDSQGQQFWHATEVCCDFEHSNVDDAGYLKGLIAGVAGSYAVDPARIFAFGHSNGGFMANRLACEADSPVSGIVSLAGSTFLNPADCHAAKPISALQIQAVDDPTVAYAGSAGLYPGSLETQSRWAAHDGCAPTPVVGDQMNVILSLPGDDTTPSTWQGCQGGASVALWTLRAATPLELNFHNPHIPLLGLDFTDRALAFLMPSN